MNTATTIKSEWLNNHSEEIKAIYPKFVKSLEKKNRIIDKKVTDKNKAYAKKQSGEELTPSERSLLNFNPYSCGDILDKEFKRFYGKLFEDCPFRNHMQAIEKELRLNMRNIFKYNLKYFS